MERDSVEVKHACCASETDQPGTVYSAAGGSGSPKSASPEQRNAMIAEAAYFLAQSRGFAPGCEMEDWLLAEKQIAAQLGETPTASEGPKPAAIPTSTKRGRSRDRGRSAS